MAAVSIIELNRHGIYNQSVLDSQHFLQASQGFLDNLDLLWRGRILGYYIWIALLKEFLKQDS